MRGFVDTTGLEKIRNGVIIVDILTFILTIVGCITGKFNFADFIYEIFQGSQLSYCVFSTGHGEVLLVVIGFIMTVDITIMLIILQAIIKAFNKSNMQS